MKIQKLNRKYWWVLGGTTIIIIAVMACLYIPNLLDNLEKKRAKKDAAAMSEIGAYVALRYMDDDALSTLKDYVLPNNYITYSDSTGVYGQASRQGEYFAPDGNGLAMTITFNPDADGTYVFANGIINNMTRDNGSVGAARARKSQQCTLKDLGMDGPLDLLEQRVGPSFTMRSKAYKKSSYTIFITFQLVDGVQKTYADGMFNGLYLTDESLAALGSGTESYDHNGNPISTNMEGGTTTPNFDVVFLEDDETNVSIPDGILDNVDTSES